MGINTKTDKIIDMRRLHLTFIIALLTTMLAVAQSLPQFAYDDYDGWSYTGGEITQQSFSRGIALYVTSQGNLLTLSSPYFSCQGMDSIAILIRWTSQDMAVGVTVVIDNDQGAPCDSARCLPTSSASSQKLTCSLPVPHGSSMARLRFFSKDAEASNCGFIKRIELTPVTSTPGGGGDDQPVIGDVDGNGRVDIADVSTLIDMLLTGDDVSTQQSADVDQDGEVNIADVAALIDKLLSGN